MIQIKNPDLGLIEEVADEIFASGYVKKGDTSIVGYSKHDGRVLTITLCCGDNGEIAFSNATKRDFELRAIISKIYSDWGFFIDFFSINDREMHAQVYEY